MLAKVLEEYEDEMVCDLAETYHIYDYEEIKGRRLSTLVCGLRPSSRLMMKLTEQKKPMDECLLAAILDVLNLILWTKTKNASKGQNRPKPVLDYFIDKSKNETNFETPNDFEQARKEILERINNG